MIFALGKWRLEFRKSHPVINWYVQFPRQWGVWYENT